MKERNCIGAGRERSNANCWYGRYPTTWARRSALAL